MTRDEIAARARTIIGEHFDDTVGHPLDRELTAETAFVADLGFDSLDIVEVAMAFEDAFDIEIDDADVERLKTFGQAVEYLAGRLEVAA